MQLTAPSWIRISIGGAASLLIGMGLGRFSYTPLVPALVDSGTLNAAEAGYVGSFNLLGYLIGALAALRILDSLGETRTLKFSLVVSLGCLAASIPDLGFLWLAFWRFLVGAAVAVIMIGSLTIVTRHAPPNRLGRSTGICFTGVGIGILLSGTLIPQLLDHSLAAAWTGIAVVGLLVAGVGLWGINGVTRLEAKKIGSEEKATPSQSKRPPMTTAILCLIGGQTMFSLGLVPHTIYWVDYIVRGLGHNIAFGGFQWVLFGLGAVSGTYLWGRLADLVGFRAGLILVFSALAASIALPFLKPALWTLAFSSLVVGAQPGFSAIISGRTHQIVGPVFMAQVWRWMALTSGVFQAIGGYLYVMVFDKTTNYTLIFLIGAGAMAFGALISSIPGKMSGAQRS